jgi:outer membrane biosynthesis protein TonB
VRPTAAPPKPAESQANEASPAPEAQPRQAQSASSAPQVAAAPPPRDPVIDSRSALRRGAPGAGGFGEGRAGIEGDPIALNSTDKRFADYLIRVKRMIQDKWTYPCIKNSGTRECEYKSAQLVVEFGILRDGQVPYVTIHQPAAWDVYDSVAVNAIKLAAPFPPVPASLMAMVKPGSTGVPIVAHFHYVLDSASIMNFLR